MSYSRLWGGGAWYIYADVGGHLQIYFPEEARTDGSYLCISENQHIAPMLEGLADQLADNIAGADGRPPAPPSEEDWEQIAAAHAVLSDLLSRRQDIGAGPNTVKYGGQFDELFAAAAPCDRNPEGEDPKGLSAKHESPVGEAEAHK